MEQELEKSLVIVEKWLRENFKEGEIVAIRSTENALMINRADNQNKEGSPVPMN